MENESRTLFQILQMEKERKYQYRTNQIPYQPHIYHINSTKIRGPRKRIYDRNTTYDKEHWMIGNIITNKAFRSITNKDRDFARWYSIDGLTSHRLTYDSFIAIAPLFKHFYLIEKRENPTLREIPRKTFEETSTHDLVWTARRVLSSLARRFGDERISLEVQSDLRYFLERSVVKFLQDPKQIADFMEYVIKEHPHVHDCGYEGGAHCWSSKRIIAFE